MAKTQRIVVTNFKALAQADVNFNGCTAIITAGNNKGKTTLLRGIVDRIRGSKPEVIVKEGEKEGRGVIELTTGEKFVWEFDNEGTDKLTFVTTEGFKTKATKEIRDRYYPPQFDIDKFMNSSPKEGSKQLQKAVGLDFSEIDARYQLAYDDRTAKNRESERFHAKLSKMEEPPFFEFVDIEQLKTDKETIRKKLNDLYTANKKHNEGLREKYDEQCEVLRGEIDNFNDLQERIAETLTEANEAHATLVAFGYEGKEVPAFIETLPKAQPAKVYAAPAPPTYIVELPDDKELQEIDEKLLAASETNSKAQAYKDFKDYCREVEAAKQDALDADELVKNIRDEREQMIRTAKMPKGIAFDEDGNVTVDGFLLDVNTISTSRRYTAALRIASINMGEVRTLHFDASSLDKNTLGEIQEWADANDLQLLIERADFAAGEISYELIEHA
jgi:hypothetical protein